MPAILVETAFISNASDANLLRNRQDDFATAIANEIIKYFGGSTSNEFNINDFLKYASNTGLFEGCGVEFKRLDEKTNINVISLNPLITVQGEVSLTEKLGGPRTAIDLSVGAETTGKDLLKQIAGAGSTFNVGETSLALSIKNLTLSTNIGRFLKYSVEMDILGVMTVTFETKLENKFGVTAYQRVIVKIYPLKGQTAPSIIRVPVKATAQDKIDYDKVFDIACAIILVACIGAGIYFGAAYLITLIPVFAR